MLHHERQFLRNDEMDDPWGSPWADESLPISKLDKPASKRSVTPEKTGLSQDSRSPWEDVDRLGQWVTLPAIDGQKVGEQDGPEQAEILEWNASVSNKFAEGNDYVRPDGSAWFSRETQHADKGSLGLETPKVTGRALSPDPWVAEIEENVQAPQGSESSPEEDSTTIDTEKEMSRTTLASVKTEDCDTTQDIDRPGNVPPLNVCGDASNDEPYVSHGHDELSVVLDSVPTKTQSEYVSHGELVASRPSSSPSDRSRHDEVSTESPRTSFEEEKTPKLDREGASKVKKMVRLFDGLAGNEGSSELPRNPRDVDSSDSRIDSLGAGQPEDDFGDFEESVSYVTGSVVTTEVKLNTEGEKSLATSGVLGVSKIATIADQCLADTSEKPPVPHTQLRFEPDLSILGVLFVHKSDAEFTYADAKQVPEMNTVIQDSFTSTDERKTWYRMSRYSTMRNHNAGDEDSYVRVNWKDSKVRADTLKIVERWIEEDRISGGVNLGGGTRLGSMFGWGQKNAVPMSVAAALASRREEAGTRLDHVASPTSVRNSDADLIDGRGSRRKSSEQISASRNSFQSPASASTPQFSWSTGNSISTAPNTVVPALAAPVPLANSLQAFDNSTFSSALIQGTSSRNPSRLEDISATSQSLPAQHAKTVRHNVPRAPKAPEPSASSSRPQTDDDWGDMISSPALENSRPTKSSFKDQKSSGAIESPRLETNPVAASLDHSSEQSSNVRMTASRLDHEVSIAPSFPSQPNAVKAASPTDQKSDAWTTADFSFFDSPAPSKPAPVPVKIVSNSVHVSVTQSRGFSREQAEQDSIVKSVVQNLPDLSYMLRR